MQFVVLELVNRWTKNFTATQQSMCKVWMTKLTREKWQSLKSLRQANVRMLNSLERQVKVFSSWSRRQSCNQLITWEKLLASQRSRSCFRVRRLPTEKTSTIKDGLDVVDFCRPNAKISLAKELRIQSLRRINSLRSEHITKSCRPNSRITMCRMRCEI